MRKLLTLIGFILIMFGIWGWNIDMMMGEIGDIYVIFSFSFIAGIIITIAGIVMHPKELNEPFKGIAEKFERMNKPILIASILIFFASLWFFLYGISGILYYHATEISLHIPLTNTSVNETISNTILGSIIHTYNTTILILSYIELFTGAIYVTIGINAMERKHLDFIASSLVFGSVLTILFRYFLITSSNAWNAGNVGIIGITIERYDIVSSISLLIPLILSIIALLLLLWQYKEYKSK